MIEMLFATPEERRTELRDYVKRCGHGACQLNTSMLEEMNRVLVNSEDPLLHDINPVHASYFEKGYFGIGFYFGFASSMIGFAFMKNPQTRPETMTQVREEYRSCGVAIYLRNELLTTYRDKFVGNVVYSAAHHTNPASIKSLIKSGYQLFDLTGDGNLQFVKVLPY